MDDALPTGFYPFWFWNDHLTAEEVRWQVRQMAAQGVRGFFIHPRQGLGQPYLSEAFFEMVDVAVDEAEACGLFVHLYDEYPYPSGVAGGEVILGNPQFQATALVTRVHEVPGGLLRLELPRGQVLSLVAYPVRDGQTAWGQGMDLRERAGIVLTADTYLETGLTNYNRKRYLAARPTPVLEAVLPRVPHRIFAAVQVEVERHKYWGRYVDVLNEEAVRRFIALTHERYRRRYGRRFGRTIISIFTDETEPHWSARLPAAFRQEYGYDLCPLLPALADPTHPEHIRVSRDLYRLRYRLFCDAFERPVSEWCRRHGLLYTGEKPSLRLAQLRFMDIPGCEPGHTKAGAPLDLLRARIRQNARATASAAYFYGKPGALDECYHSLGWSATLQDARLLADAMLLMGIRYLVPHGFFYSTHALRKHDAPPTFFFQVPYWPFFGRLARRVERIARHLAGTHINAGVLVVDPASGLPSPADLAAYERLLALLSAGHIDLHIGDTDVLEAGTIEGPVVRLRDLQVRLVIVPPMLEVEGPLARWLERFEEGGGAVIRCAADFAAADLLERVRAIAPPSLSVRVAGVEAPQALVVKRVAPEKTLWFVLNTSGETLEAEIDSSGPLGELEIDEGHPAFLTQRDGAYVRVIHPYEGFLLSAEAGELAPPLPRIEVPLDGAAQVCPVHPNLLRLYDWRLSLLDAGGRALGTATVPALPLSNQLERSGLSFAPAFRHYFGHPPELELPPLRLRYACSFENDYCGPVELVMEPGSIVGEWGITVNGSGAAGDGGSGRGDLSDRARPIGPEDLRPSAAHVRGSLGVEISSLLRPGANTIEVEVTTARPDGGLINALYLAGDFGVCLHPARLVERSDAGRFEDYAANGLPYYAGAVEYRQRFTLGRLPDGPRLLAYLTTAGPFHEACEVSLNGGAYVPVLWEPRCLMMEVSQLRVGENELSVRVYSSLSRAFEGQWFDYRAHEHRDVTDPVSPLSAQPLT